jgi:hypothetical protein
MAIPTILQVTPNRGATGGQTLLEIHGTGFQLPATPALVAGETPAPPPSVRVFFGGVEARRVRVASSSRLLIITPPHVKGATTVEVRNVDSQGATIPGEVATLANGYTYVMPDLTKDTTITRIVRKLMDELINQVFPEVVRTQSVDWTDTPASALRKIATAKVPCLLLAGPTIRKNGQYIDSEPIREQLADGVREYKPPRVVDLVFTLGALTRNTVHLDGLAHALTNFVQRTTWLYLDRVPGDASSGQVRYEVAIEPNGDMDLSTEPSQSDLKSCAGTISIRAVPLEGLGLEGDMGTDVHPPMTQAPQVSTQGE